MFVDRFITNRYLRIDRTQDVEWGYAFDIHLNAVFPPLIIVHILQLFLYNGEISHIFRLVKYTIEQYLMCFIFAALINNNTFTARFLGNTFWFIAVIYYIYITFLGYASKLRMQNLDNTIYISSPLIVTCIYNYFHFRY